MAAYNIVFYHRSYRSAHQGCPRLSNRKKERCVPRGKPQRIHMTGSVRRSEDRMHMNVIATVDEHPLVCCASPESGHLHLNLASGK